MGHKILLADDSITVQKIVKLTFNDEGMEVVAVGNGEVASQELMDWQPDLVLADVFMPGRDGYEVCQFIKTHPDLCHIPVVLLVHAFEPFDQARADEVKADCHLTKPFHSIRTLVTTVRELIEKNAQPDRAAAATQNSGLSSASGAALRAGHTEDSGRNAGSYDTAPLQDPTQPSGSDDTDSGEVMELEPAAFETESTLPPLARAGQETERSATDLSDGQASAEESAELLSLDNPDGLSFGFEAPAVSGITFRGNEEISLPAISDAGSLQVAGTESRGIASRAGSPAAHLAGDEVLELEEILPGLPLGQVGEMDLLIETGPLQVINVKADKDSTDHAAIDTEEVISFPMSDEADISDWQDDQADKSDRTGALELSGPVDLPPAIALCEGDMPDSIRFEDPVLPVHFGSANKDAVDLQSGIGHSDQQDHAVGKLLTDEDEEMSLPVAATDSRSSDSQDISLSVESALPEVREKQDLQTGFVANGSVRASAEPESVNEVPAAVIDEIVNRVVARLSEKAIQEIAWEVVPEMAELLIRRQLAEKSH